MDACFMVGWLHVFHIPHTSCGRRCATSFIVYLSVCMYPFDFFFQFPWVMRAC